MYEYNADIKELQIFFSRLEKCSISETIEEKTDFRDQLAKSEIEIPAKPEQPQEAEQVDFRAVLQTEV